MARPRAHVSLTTKLASALLALGDIPYEDAKLMTADQIISLYQFDHNALHAFGGSHYFWNITPMLITPHRRKSAEDKKKTAKAVRIDKANAVHAHARAAAALFGADGIVDSVPIRRVRKIPSRPFPKGHRPLRSRSSFKKRGQSR